MATAQKYRLGKLTLEIEYPPSRKREPPSEGSKKVLDDFLEKLDPASSARVAELEIAADCIKLFRRRRSRATEDELIVPLILYSNKPTEAMLVTILNMPYMQIDMRYLVGSAAGNDRIEWKPLADRVASALWMEWAVKGDY